MTGKLIVVLTAVPDRDEGLRLAHGLVEGRLAACVQVLPQMTSVYLWEEKNQEETEHLLLIKTVSENWAAVSSYISDNHSYTVPEIVAIDAANVSAPYAEWLRSALAD